MSNSDPPLDLSDPKVKEFIERAKADAAVYPRAVRKFLPGDASAIRLMDAMAMLAEMGIKDASVGGPDLAAFTSVGLTEPVFQPKKFVSWTRKERAWAVLAFAGAALAGYGALMLSAAIIDRPRSMDPLSPLICLVVFFATLFLMGKGVDAIRGERTKKDLEGDGS